MFASAASVFVLALPLLATATVLPRTDGDNQCNSGSLQCCDSTSTVTCSPLTVVGVSGTSCNDQAVCCTNNSFNGVVALGCTPINLNL
ncbi:type 1 hydrophobin [Phlegmacium glaucopus]|nr:type 1 hydrophobin [Phlegmacium glaucopus]